MKKSIFINGNMKISGIGSLFTSAISPSSGQQRSTPVEEVKSTPAVAEQDAVVVSARLREQQEQAQAANSDRASRLEKIAQQVKQGSYRVDTTKVAEALRRDLM